MFPREHGAYGQMAMPIVTSFGVAGVSMPAALLATAVVAGFLAHEPLLVLLGRRGGRARRESRGRAVVWLIVTTMAAGAAGATSLWSMPNDVRWSLVLPLLPAVVLAVAIAAGREKGAVAEAAVATAFSLVAIPLCLSAGASIAHGAAIAAVFAAIFVTGTLAVRSIVVATRGGGNPRAARAMRAVVLVMTATALVALAVTGARARLPWAALMAAAPGLGAAFWLALFPPAPTRLRTIGWTLVATSTAAVLVLIVSLAAAP